VNKLFLHDPSHIIVSLVRETLPWNKETGDETNQQDDQDHSLNDVLRSIIFFVGPRFIIVSLFDDEVHLDHIRMIRTVKGPN